MLNKNSRFKNGGKVDIFYAPIYTNTTRLITTSVVGNKFRITAHISDMLNIQMFSVGDIAGFKFGAGEIVDITMTYLVVEFPDSTFPKNDFKEFVGSDFQEVVIFFKDQRVLKNVLTTSLNEKTEVAVNDS